MDDKEVISYFFKGNKLITGRVRNIVIDKNQELKEYLLNRFPDSSSYSETIYRIKLGIEIRPVCETCKGYVNYIGNGKFYKHCSYNCMNNDKNKIKLGLNSIYKKFSKDNYNNRKKYKETCLEKFGVIHPWKNKEVLNKCRKTCLDKHGFEYTLQDKDNLMKCVSLSHTKEVMEKKYNTCIERFGNRIPSKTPEIRNMLKDIWTRPETKIKAYNTKKKNNSFGPKSKIESIVYMYLSLYYPDTIRQYMDIERYPYNCDFYIPSLDLFIEYQGYYTHGFHPFNKDNKEDIDRLNILKEKYREFYENHGYDHQIIDIWTKRDVEKRNCAKKNKLNYIEFFNFKEFKEWLEGE